MAEDSDNKEEKKPEGKVAKKAKKDPKETKAEKKPEAKAVKK